MTELNLGSMWRPAKNPNDPNKYIVRSATTVHTSPRVKAVNDELKKVAKKCAKPGQGRQAFRDCVADEMEGFKAPSKVMGPSSRSKRAA